MGRAFDGDSCCSCSVVFQIVPLVCQGNRLRYTKRMLDHPVFKMSFFFALIIGATIFLLGVSGYYDQGSAPGQEGALQKFFKFE